MTDLIRRADAIEALGEEPEIIFDTDAEWEMHDRWVDAMTSMKSLPSADAEQVTGKLKKPCDSLLTGDSDERKEHKSKLESAEAVQGWIPFTRRPMTEEEQKDYPNCTFMFDCVLPDDGDEILVSNRRFVWMDTFCSDIDGCYLDSGDDIDEDMAWMPLPTPYKGGDE